MRNTPNFVFSAPLFSAAARLNPNTFLVSLGSITPSSHNLKNELKLSLDYFT
jgi:hypothetical protein